MRLCFFHSNGSPEMARNYWAPGRYDFGPVEQVQHEAFAHAEGAVVPFHVGHGVLRDYLVAAKDDDVVLLQRV
jgi:hypothetical protein